MGSSAKRCVIASLISTVRFAGDATLNETDLPRMTGVIPVELGRTFAAVTSRSTVTLTVTAPSMSKDAKAAISKKSAEFVLSSMAFQRCAASAGATFAL